MLNTRMSRAVALCLLFCLVISVPMAAFAAGTSTPDTQNQPQEDYVTKLIWVIAALSVAEIIRNSIQGLFARLSGFNEAGFAQKAVGAITGMGALFGLATLGKASFGSFMGGGGGQEHSGSSHGGGGIDLGGTQQSVESVIPKMTASDAGGGASGAPGGQTVGPAANAESSSGGIGGLKKAAGAGTAWGRSVGSFARAAATNMAAGAMGIAGAAIPDGDRLAQIGSQLFDKTVGRGIEHAGNAAGRFVGTNASLLHQSFVKSRKSGGQSSMSESFQNVTGTNSLGEAQANSLKLSGAHAIHPRLGQRVLDGMQNDSANRPVTGNMDNGVSYK